MKNIKNSTLLIIFGILALLAVVFYFYDSKKGERSFRSELFTIDSSKVSRITINPKTRNKAVLVLSGSGKDWKIAAGNKSYPADTNVVFQIISSLVSAKPERVSGTDRSSWKEYEVTDTSSVRVIVEQGNDVAADFRVGKMSYNMGSRGYGGRQGMSVKSNIRVAGDDKVYVVNGFLSMLFGEEVSAYRNRILCRFNRTQVSKLTFSCPGDSSFILQKQDNKWMLMDKPADSASVVNYLGSLASLFNGEFADEKDIPVTYPFTLKIEGTNFPAIELQGYANADNKHYFVKSNMNPAVFGGASPSLFRQVFPGKGKFEPGKSSGKPEKADSKTKKSNGKTIKPAGAPGKHENAPVKPAGSQGPKKKS